MALTAPTSFALSNLTGSDLRRYPFSFPDHFLVVLYFSASPRVSTCGGSPCRTWCEPAFPGASFSIARSMGLSTFLQTKSANRYVRLCILHKTLRLCYTDFSKRFQSTEIWAFHAFSYFSPYSSSPPIFPSKVKIRVKIVYKSVICNCYKIVTIRVLMFW